MLQVKSQYRKKKIKYYHSIYLFVLSFSISQTVFGQQLPQYTQFAINPYIVNPAIAGTEDFTHLKASFRSQWSGFEQAPNTGYLTGHSTINKRTIGYTHKKFAMEHWFSLGGIFTYDEAGPIKQVSSYATFSYNIPLSNEGVRLSFGMNAGLKNFSYDPEGFTTNLLDSNDPFIQNGYSSTVFDMASGFWLYNKKIFIGASSFQLLESELKNNFSTGENISKGSLMRHYFIMAGGKINIHRKLYVVPSALVKSIPSLPLSFEVNSKFVYKNNFWIGGNYRDKESFSAFIGMLINERFEVSYAHDIIISSIKHSAAASHEILIGYRINKDSKILCPSEFW